MTDTQTTDADRKLEYCANCGERHTEAAMVFAKLIGASSALMPEMHRHQEEETRYPPWQLNPRPN